MAKQYYFKSSTGDIFATSYPEYHKNDEMLSNKEGSVLYREQLINKLLQKIKPNQTIYCVLRSRANSGMSRVISFFTIHEGELINLDYSISVICGYSLKNEGIRVNGCGSDAGHDVVYSLGRSLWANGTPEPHGTRNGEPDSCGGYALKHSWI